MRLHSIKPIYCGSLDSGKPEPLWRGRLIPDLPLTPKAARSGRRQRACLLSLIRAVTEAPGCSLQPWDPAVISSPPTVLISLREGEQVPLDGFDGFVSLIALNSSALCPVGPARAPMLGSWEGGLQRGGRQVARVGVRSVPGVLWGSPMLPAPLCGNGVPACLVSPWAMSLLRAGILSQTSLPQRLS